jgi:hypothetical protein
MEKLWEVALHDEFIPEFRALSAIVQEELVALTLNLREKGPLLGRPEVDTLKGSAHSNMKELRFHAEGGVWRVAFAFDPKRTAILLVAGDKSGVGQKSFYRELIRKADERFGRHLKAQSSQRRR